MSQKRDCTDYYARHEVHWEDFTLDLRKRVSGQRFKHRKTCKARIHGYFKCINNNISSEHVCIIHQKINL